MKSILFCLQTMVCGGVEKELITILKLFDRNRFKISLLVLYKGDDKIMSQIPDDVELINLSIDKEYYCSGFIKFFISRLSQLKLISAIKGLYKRVIKCEPVSSFVDLSQLPDLKESYDVSICYHIHSPICMRYVIEKTKASRYIAWIHNDFSTTKFRIEKYAKWLDKFNKYVCVSSQLKDEFLSRYPIGSYNTLVCYNVVDTEEINLKANLQLDDNDIFVTDNGFKILTVGRFVEQKGFDLAILACKLIIEKGYNVKWYAIGYGIEEENMVKLVEKYNLQDNFIILGRKENPYPYMRLADLYVQPSRHEGFSITVEEVKAIGTYMLLTDFAGAREQIISGKNGALIEEYTPNAIADSIVAYINNPITCEKISEDGNNNWKKIESLFNE